MIVDEVHIENESNVTVEIRKFVVSKGILKIVLCVPNRAAELQRALDEATVEWVCACGLSQSKHVGVACEHRAASNA